MSLVHQDSVNRITSLVAALQHYVAANTLNGLTDVAASVEALVCEMLRITEGLELINLNLFHSNFPAIDLADSKRKVAVQVTSNATSAKCKDTIDKFSTHGLGANYQQLRIFGFCKTTKPKNLPSHVTVEGMSALLGGLKTLSIEQLNGVEQLLRSSYDFSKLNPLNDRDCFQVVLTVLNRDAIRHFTSVEGSYADLTSALKEVKEVITVGRLPSKKVYAKPLSQYSSEYGDVLQSIDLYLGQMLAEVNRARRHEHYYLTQDQKRKIDGWRSSLIQEVNDFCRSQSIAHEIQTMR